LYEALEALAQSGEGWLVIHIDVGAAASTPATLKSTSETIGTAAATTTAVARLTTRATTKVTTAATTVATCTLWFHVRMLGIYLLAEIPIVDFSCTWQL